MEMLQELASLKIGLLFVLEQVTLQMILEVIYRLKWWHIQTIMSIQLFIEHYSHLILQACQMVMRLVQLHFHYIISGKAMVLVVTKQSVLLMLLLRTTMQWLTLILVILEQHDMLQISK